MMIIIIQFLYFLGTELNSQGLITESARIQSKNKDKNKREILNPLLFKLKYKFMNVSVYKLY
jgi:hypothetical protein